MERPADRAILKALAAIRYSLETTWDNVNYGKITWNWLEAQLDEVLRNELPGLQHLFNATLAAHTAEQVVRDDDGAPIPGQGVISPDGLHLQLSSHFSPSPAGYSQHSIGHAARHILSPPTPGTLTAAHTPLAADPRIAHSRPVAIRTKMGKQHGLLREKITQIKLAYKLRKPEISLFCADLEKAAAAHPFWFYPDKYDSHEKLLHELDGVASELREINTAAGPKRVLGKKLEALQENLNACLKKAKPVLLQAIENAATAREEKEPAQYPSETLPLKALREIESEYNGNTTNELERFIETVAAGSEKMPGHWRRDTHGPFLERLADIRQLLGVTREEMDERKIGEVEGYEHMDGVLQDSLPEVLKLLDRAIKEKAANAMVRSHGEPVIGQGLIGPDGSHVVLGPSHATPEEHSIGRSARRLLSPRKQAIYARAGRARLL
ncbi:hypothetical protein JCM10908_002708 [Rhodotorula pacifica]|uniref:uncharacterized protein n=1 Tax=Rhodotorula pacifica TaxID=1495444 RepID=UPI00317587DB